MATIRNELARYDFFEVSSTIVPDLTGNGYAGVIRGCDRGGADMGADSVFGQTLPALLLSGGVNGGFLQLPDGILNTKEGFTVSFYAKLSPLSGFGTVFSFGRDYCFYLSAMPNPDNPEEILISPCATGGGRSQERCLEPWFPVPSCQWLHIAVSFSAGTPSNITLSVDGKACGSFEHPRMGAKALDHCSDCYFGFGSFAPAPIAAAITDIRIFSRTLEAHEISSLFWITPQMRLALDAGRLAGLFAKPLVKPLSLPTTGQTGTTVTWKSLTPDIISDSGEFTRPAAGRECLVGALEAALSFEDCRMAQVFQCQIQPMPEDSVTCHGRFGPSAYRK